MLHPKIRRLSDILKRNTETSLCNIQHFKKPTPCTGPYEVFLAKVDNSEIQKQDDKQGTSSSDTILLSKSGFVGRRRDTKACPTSRDAVADLARDDKTLGIYSSRVAINSSRSLDGGKTSLALESSALVVVKAEGQGKELALVSSKRKRGSLTSGIASTHKQKPQKKENGTSGKKKVTMCPETTEIISACKDAIKLQGLSDEDKLQQYLKAYNALYLVSIKEENDRCEKANKEYQEALANHRAAQEKKGITVAKRPKGSQKRLAEMGYVQERLAFKRGTKRPDLVASSKMMAGGLLMLPGKHIGPIPGIEVGQQFFGRAEMVVVGMHSHWLNGIDFITKDAKNNTYKESVCTAIVMSGGYEDDRDKANVIEYTGEGGNDLLGDKKQLADQKLVKGNLALFNSVKHQNPVRVIRGAKSSDAQRVYSYDGLYRVTKHEEQTGVRAFKIQKFWLTRIPGQAVLTSQQVRFINGEIPSKAEDCKDVVSVDLSNGLEKYPVVCTNSFDSSLPAFKYVRERVRTPGVPKPVEPKGCSCKGECDPKTLGSTGKPLVRECNLNCGCGPKCRNRTSQQGIVYKLEAFKTAHKGWAVRSWDSIPQGAHVCEYVGRLWPVSQLHMLKSDEYVMDIDVCKRAVMYKLDEASQHHELDEEEKRVKAAEAKSEVYRIARIPQPPPEDRAGANRGTPKVPAIRGSAGDRQEEEAEDMGEEEEEVDEEEEEEEEAPKNGREDCKWAIDGSLKSSVACLINHSCDPNLFLQPVLWDGTDPLMAHIVMVAMKNIPAMTELTYDYHYELDSVKDNDGNVKQLAEVLGDGRSDENVEDKSMTCEVICWGCGLCLTLPSYSPVFKCGYCGAVNQEASVRGCYWKRPQYCPRFYNIRDLIIVSLVLVLICSIIGVGVWTTFPYVCPRGYPLVLQTALTVLLSVNTLFNFVACACFDAGKPHPVEWGFVDKVPRASLQEHTFCELCEKPKPPHAHHCRVCRACVLDMDHHCPFIGNCVGANNQRHFVLFLFFAFLSCIYVPIMASLAFSRLWPSLASLKEAPPYALSFGAGGMAIAAIKSLLQLQYALSSKAVALLYLTVAGISTAIGVGFLLVQQLRLIASGFSYIESLQSNPQYTEGDVSQGPRASNTTVTNFRRIFGKGHPISWFLPHIRPPPGSRAETLFVKKRTV
eukprot:jgi/Mesen1/6027/ME000308S05226